MANALKFIIFLAVVISIAGFAVNFYFGNLLTPQAGFFVSVDKGSTWQKFGVLDTGGNISRLNITGLSHNPKDSRILYATTLGSGIYKSVNGGESWHKLTDAHKILAARADVYGLAVDPNLPDYKKKIPDRFYLGVYQNNFGRVLKTEDGGLSFKEVYIAAKPRLPVFDVKIDPNRANVVWATTGEGLLLKSQDYGETWKLVQEFGSAINSFFINPLNTSQLFVATFMKGIFTSSDGGASWVDESETLNEFPGSKNIAGVARNPADGQLYLGTRFGLLRSGNFGVNWEPVDIIFPNEALPVLDAAFGGRGSSEMYVALANLIYSTKDGGKFWQVRKLGTSKQLNVLWVDPQNNSRIIAGAGK
ncbi:MAG: hypothetical protein HY452_00390 [Parcubacteria group bacterium]|nr:hypothetical protein [Parcubacteria group bacterium]